MRFFEFGDTNTNIDKFILALKNFIGRASSKKSPSTLNWNAISAISRANGFELGMDYHTFKAMYDQNPILQSLIKDFNDNGITLKVPGAPDDKNPPQDGETPQDKVDQMASSAVGQQLDQYSKGVQA